MDKEDNVINELDEEVSTKEKQLDELNNILFYKSISNPDSGSDILNYFMESKERLQEFVNTWENEIEEMFDYSDELVGEEKIDYIEAAIFIKNSLRGDKERLIQLDKTIDEMKNRG